MRIIQIRRKIGLSSFDEVRALFNAYWEEVFGTYDFSLAKAKMVSLFTILIDDCTSCYQVHSDESPPFLPADEISPLSSLAEWNSWALSAFNRLYQCARQTRTGKFPLPLVKAIAFIDENFVKQIQLHDAAEAANVSTAYLSRLFGEHMNSSFIDYLTVLRVERAEKLIRENRSSIKEVSFAVGYQDPNYFSKIFRKIVGISPSMYAQRGLYEE
jgi:two-component system response regulator YesN